MRKPYKHKPSRTPSSVLMSFAHKAYEFNRWNPCAYDDIKVIISPQVGAKQVRILTRKEALKLAAKQRLDSWGYHANDSQFKRVYAHIGVFLNRGRTSPLDLGKVE